MVPIFILLTDFFSENTPPPDFSIWSVIRARILPKELQKESESNAFFWYCIHALPQVSRGWCNKKNHFDQLVSGVTTDSDEALLFWFFLKEFSGEFSASGVNRNKRFRELVYLTSDVGTDAAHFISADFLAFVDLVDDTNHNFDGRRFDTGVGFRLWIALMKLIKQVRCHPCNRMAELSFKNRCIDELSKRGRDNEETNEPVLKKLRGSVGFHFDYEEIAGQIAPV
jgi:hypothetical protein